MPDLSLTAETGRTRGSRASNRLRNEGKVPAVVYGHGEDPVAVERGTHSLEKSLKRGIVAQFTTSGRFEKRQAGIRVRLWKRGVEGDDADPITREELMNHQGELVATPGPVSLGLEASLIDVHDDDAWVAR